MSRRKQYRPVRVQEEDDDTINDDDNIQTPARKPTKTSPTSSLSSSKCSENSKVNSGSDNGCALPVLTTSTDYSSEVVVKSIPNSPHSTPSPTSSLNTTTTLSSITTSIPAPVVPTSLSSSVVSPTTSTKLFTNASGSAKSTTTSKNSKPKSSKDNSTVPVNDKKVSTEKRQRHHHRQQREQQQQHLEQSNSNEKTVHLENQITATTNGDSTPKPCDPAAMQELAVLQSTFFALQQQQLQQMQLIQELQSQLQLEGADSEEADHDEVKSTRSRSPTPDKSEPKQIDDNQTVTKLDILNPMLSESAIINPDFDGAASPLNSLEMLQKRTQEVLETASQSMNGNLADELAYNKSQSKNEPFFKHRCRYCGKIFGSDSALQIHLRSHTGERPYRCNMCSSSFTTKGNLKVHYQRHTSMNYASPIPPPMTVSSIGNSAIRPPLFNAFGFPFPSPPLDFLKSISGMECDEPELKRARVEEKPSRTPSPVPPPPPPPPPRSVSPKSPRLRPLRSNKSTPDRAKSEEKNSSSPTMSYTNVFPRYGTKDRSWENFIEVTKTPETSKLQQLVDNIENKLNDPNECPVCHKVLSCKSSLLMHYRIHTGEKPFRCKLCGRPFTTKGNLKVHMSIHRVKEPFAGFDACPICHKKFSNIFALQQHIRSHTGEATEMTAEQLEAAEMKTDSMSPVSSMDFGMSGSEDQEEYQEEYRGSDMESALDLTPPLNKKVPVPAQTNESNSTITAASVVSPNNDQRKRTDSNGDAKLEQFQKQLLQRQLHSLQQSSLRSGGKDKSDEVLLETNDTVASDKQQSDDRRGCSDENNITVVKQEAVEDDEDNGGTDVEEELDKHNQDGIMCSLCGKRLQSKTEENRCSCFSLQSRKGELRDETEAVNLSKKKDQTEEETPPARSDDSPLRSSHDDNSHCPTNNELESISNMVDKSLSLLRSTKIEISTAELTPSEGESPINMKHYCKICKKNFSSSSALQIHSRTHSGERPFCCHVCSKSFTTKGNLKVHMGTHMWTNGASRRGRRMSLELPLSRPLSFNPQDAEFLTRRPELFYPFLPTPFLSRPPFPLLQPPSPGKFPAGFPSPFSLLHPLGAAAGADLSHLFGLNHDDGKSSPVIGDDRDDVSNSSAEDMSTKTNGS